MLHRAFCYCSVIVLLSGHQTEGRRNVRGATRRDVFTSRRFAPHKVHFPELSENLSENTIHCVWMWMWMRAGVFTATNCQVLI